jgi:hypothetical protein
VSPPLFFWGVAPEFKMVGGGVPLLFSCSLLSLHALGTCFHIVLLFSSGSVFLFLFSLHIQTHLVL